MGILMGIVMKIYIYLNIPNDWYIEDIYIYRYNGNIYIYKSYEEIYMWEY